MIGLWRLFNRDGTPEYLARHYWWAYLWRHSAWFFDHQPIINAILFGQYRRLMDETLRRFAVGGAGRTLQLTCVYGHLTPALARQVGDGELVLMDVAPVQLRLARRKLQADPATRRQGTRLARMNAESLAYAGDSFDTVLIFFLLHELPPDARRRVLAEALRVLRPGGRLLITEYGAYTTSHVLHRVGPLRAVLGALEPFLPGFWCEDLDAEVASAAAAGGKDIAASDHTPLFGAFYRVVEYRLVGTATVPD